MGIKSVIPMNRAVHIEKHIHIIECANCNVDFGIGDDFKKRRRKDHETFYCPNGHGNCYSGDNAEEELRKENERLKNRLENVKWAKVAADDQRKAAERRVSAAKGQVTKLKKRIGNGICPCCNRHFANVERHIKSQHPDHLKAESNE